MPSSTRFSIACRQMAAMLGLLIASDALAEIVKLPVVQDNSIVLVDGEWAVNAGGQGRMRVKGNQHIVAMGFDMGAIVGRRIRGATLVCEQSDQVISGVTLSTIATPWDESKSTGLTAGVEGVVAWGYSGARFPAVIGGNSFTLVHHSSSVIRGGSYHWDVAPDLVYALAIGIAHGIAIHEDDADYGRNPTIFSREQGGRQPFLLVELEEPTEATNSLRPNPPSDLLLSRGDGPSARLSLTAPSAGFAYEVTVNGQALARHNIPLVQPGVKQVIPIRDLPNLQTENHFAIEVLTIDRLGQRSLPVALDSELASIKLLPTTNVASPRGQMPQVENLWVIPITDKYDMAGQPVGNLSPDYRVNNGIFDGRRIRLLAAAGEVVGFQLLLRGNSAVSIDVAMSDASLDIDRYQAIYVPSAGRQIPDPLVPLAEALQLRLDSDQAVVIDVAIPFDAQPGLRRGSVSLSDGRSLPLEIEVLPIQLPRAATFLCEMNGYGLPDRVADYEALQRVAYEHRLHANILHYSHHTAAPGARKSNLDMRLASGKRMDNRRYDAIEPGAEHAYWDDFILAFGPHISGSLFRDGYRGPIAAPGFYLTFHESWPLNCRAYFNGEPDAFQAFAAQTAYSQTYVNILRDFVRTAQAEGWKQAGFQVYFNNKGSLAELTKAPWILDEPSSYWDYRALRYYGELTDRGREAIDTTQDKRVQVDYRIDISRPEFTRGQLDGRDDLWIVSSSAFQNYRRLVTDRIERDGLKAWVYGTTNHVHESNRTVQAWALDAWQHGATGIVPWQTVNKSGSALREADQLGLYIWDDSSGEGVWRHSLRLKAYREAQQLIELLNLLSNRGTWTKSQMRDFVAAYVNLDGEVSKLDEDDAGTSAYARLSAEHIDSLKRAAIQLLIE